MRNRSIIRNRQWPILVALVVFFAVQYDFRAEQNADESTPSLTELEVPNADQKKQLRSLIQQIAGIEQTIGTMYDDLKVLGEVKDEKTVLYLAAEYMGDAGNQDRRFFINDRITIFWKDGQPSRFELFRRQAKVRGIYIIRKTMTAESMVEAARAESLSVPVQILVDETLESGLGVQTQFRLPGPNQDNLEDSSELVETTTGSNKRVAIVYLRRVEDRMDVLRKYLQFLRDSENRIRFIIKNKLREDSMRYQRTKTLE
ncbi:MAG: hypothetical protein KDK37_11680 [Leptospiraceae bacterium]|nr:hypothetical protein [Leptospiraceae bacterium]